MLREIIEANQTDVSKELEYEIKELEKELKSLTDRGEIARHKEAIQKAKKKLKKYWS